MAIKKVQELLNCDFLFKITISPVYRFIYCWHLRKATTTYTPISAFTQKQILEFGSNVKKIQILKLLAPVTQIIFKKLLHIKYGGDGQKLNFLPFPIRYYFLFLILKLRHNLYRIKFTLFSVVYKFWKNTYSHISTRYKTVSSLIKFPCAPPPNSSPWLIWIQSQQFCLFQNIINMESYTM